MKNFIFCAVLKHEEMCCIDEQVVSLKRRSSLKQYNPQKPKKWVYKFYVLAGVDGLLNLCVSRATRFEGFW